MRVLIADFDLFRLIGGGQTVYRRLVETNPQIEFSYPIRKEAPDAPRPPNATAIPFREDYHLADFGAGFCDVQPPRWIYGAFIQASNFAASVAGRSFDVVELPDYEQFGVFLAPALERHGVHAGRISLSMHGSISKTVSLNWTTEGSTDSALRTQEILQYRTADTRYGISAAYLDEWRAEVPELPAHYLHPFRFFELPEPVLSASSASPPSLNFVGRTEKRKGPDLFLELVEYLARDSYDTANVIGPQSVDPHGVGSGFYLHRMSNNREVDVNILPAKSAAELAELFRSRSITVLPSRYDSLNLVALESLFSGCPTAIGSGAGVCRFLREAMPSVPFITIDIDNLYACVPELEHALANYDDYRRSVVEGVRSAAPEITGDDLDAIYSSPRAADPAVRVQLSQWFEDLAELHEACTKSAGGVIRSAKSRLLRAVVTPKRYRQVLALKNRLRRALTAPIRAVLMPTVFSNDSRIAGLALKSRRLRTRYRDVFLAPEQTGSNIAAKLGMCRGIASDLPLDRVRVWKEIARLERLRGNDLIAATFELRVMRTLDDDRFGHLPGVAGTLEQHGYAREAETAKAMFGPRETRDERCFELIQGSYQRLLADPERPFDHLDDRRGSASPRVSIIVSLYNAAEKIPRFLASLKNQTLLKRGQAEVIFVETGSPVDDYGAFRREAESIEFAVLYAKTDRRETIQSAWNRGIGLARAPYLCFLGVDETVLPDCLETLANELDADSTVDWIQANSLVTEVDENGNWKGDIMPYDRTGGRQESVYLETCYLSWVGALYRKSIHERFGYYDATFRAAGDTEFKNRLLPHLKTKYLPRTLGVFWNYPDDRTTQSPRAEIEDLRAWYLHRTPAGVRYALEGRDVERAEQLFYDCLGYRKSYCRHQSTDVELACNVAALIASKTNGSSIAPLAADVRELLADYRGLDLLPREAGPAAALIKARRRAAKLQRRHRELGNGSQDACYEIFNDNRYEQHTFTWTGD